MAEPNIGKITQIIGAVLDIKFSRGHLPQINEAIKIDTADGVLTVEVAQHLGDDIVRTIAMGSTDGLVRGMEARLQELLFQFLLVKTLWVEFLMYLERQLIRKNHLR